MNPDFQQIFKRNVQPPGGLAFLHISPPLPGIIEYRPGIGVGVPFPGILLEKIDGLSLIPCLALEMLHGNPNQIQIAYRKIVRPELSGKLCHFTAVPGSRQKLHPPVQPGHLDHQVSGLKRGFPFQVSVVGVGQGTEVSLEPGQLRIVADDGQPFQVVQHVRRDPGQPGAQKLLQEFPHLSGYCLDFRQVVGRRFRSLPQQGFPGDDSGLQLAPEDGRCLVLAQFLFVAGTGGVLQRRQKLYHVLLSRKADGDYRGILYLGADVGRHLVHEGLKLPVSEGFLQFGKGVGFYFYSDCGLCFYLRGCFVIGFLFYLRGRFAIGVLFYLRGRFVIGFFLSLRNRLLRLLGICP